MCTSRTKRFLPEGRYLKMANSNVMVTRIVAIFLFSVVCASFSTQSRFPTVASKISMKSRCHSGTIKMMLPGTYRFVLNNSWNKRATTLDAGNSRTDLIQAEGSGSPCRIKVIGVGGGGGNAVNRMIESSTGVAGVELWVVNTDAQALSRSLAPRKLNIGNLTSRYCTVAVIHPSKIQ